MGKPTYTCGIVVLRKKRLKESDLILDCLKDDGSRLDLVARGALKPTNPFAARLDLFGSCRCVVAPGRSLDVVTEARLVNAHENLRTDIRQSAAALPILEALDKTAQPDLSVPRLFEMTCTALDHAAAVDAERVPAVTAAFLLKLAALLGFRPRLDECIECGRPVKSEQDWTRISFLDGGAVCDSCAMHYETVRIQETTVAWARFLLISTFNDFARTSIDVRAAFDALDFARRWLAANAGVRLKSVDFLFSSGLF